MPQPSYKYIGTGRACVKSDPCVSLGMPLSAGTIRYFNLLFNKEELNMTTNLTINRPNGIIRRNRGFPTAFPTDIFKDFEDFFGLDRFFGDLADFDPTGKNLRLTRGFPKGDVFLEDGKLILELGLAGYSKDQLEVLVEEGKLTVAAEKKDEGGEGSEGGGRALRRRSFRKVFNILPEWNLEEANVSYQDGLLRVEVPAVEPEPEPEKEVKKLEIK